MDHTDTVMHWVLSAPVLTGNLKRIADEDQEELMCTIIDLLDPNRGRLGHAYLKACGARTEHADAVWEEIDAAHGMPTVRWDEVGRVLREAYLPWMEDM